MTFSSCASALSLAECCKKFQDTSLRRTNAPGQTKCTIDPQHAFHNVNIITSEENHGYVASVGPHLCVRSPELLHDLAPCRHAPHCRQRRLQREENREQGPMRSRKPHSRGDISLSYVALVGGGSCDGGYGTAYARRCMRASCPFLPSRR